MLLSGSKRVKGHVYNRREEYFELEGREHAPLAKALLHSEAPGAHPVVEPACSHAIVELRNGQDHIMWHANTGGYCPGEGSVDGVVRFGKVEKAYIKYNCFLSRQLLQPTNYKHHTGGIAVYSETTLFLRQDLHALAVLAEAASDNFQQHLAGVHYQRDAPVGAALCSILLFMEYHDDGIFPLLRHLVPPPNTNDDIEQSPTQGGITIEGDLEQLNGDPVRPDSRSVCQRVDGAYQLLHHGLNPKQYVLGPLVKTFGDARVEPR